MLLRSSFPKLATTAGTATTALFRRSHGPSGGVSNANSMTMSVNSLTSSRCYYSTSGSRLLSRLATPTAMATRATRKVLTRQSTSRPIYTKMTMMTTMTKVRRPITMNSLVGGARGVPSNILYHQHQQTALSLQLGSLSYFSSYSPGGGGGSRRGPPGNRWMQGAGMLAGSAMVLAGKGKYILGALKLTKLASLGSMVLTIGTYSAFFGFPYAIGMVGLITVHEVGHALVMLQRGIPFSPMVFMPFMGAAIAMNRRPRDAWEDALVAFGGPVLGSLGAGGVAFAAQTTNSQLLFALADFGFMINLFNLLPIGSMDGGRILGALSKWFHVAGLGVGTSLALTGSVSNPIFYLILLAGGYETFQRFYSPEALPRNYYKITTPQRFAIGMGYVGLVLGLVTAMDLNQRYKKPPEVLIRERQLMEKSWDMT